MGHKDVIEILEELQKLLGITFTNTFQSFWYEYVLSEKANTFHVQMCKLNGSWGRRQFLQNDPNRILITINEKTPLQEREVTLAHEIMHLVLDLEGFPTVGHLQNTQLSEVWREIANDLHSILVHPVIWDRLKKSGFSVDAHLCIQATGQLADIKRIGRAPTRSQFPNWQSWTLKYILARLQWAEPERQQILDWFKSRHPAIGRQGEKQLETLYKIYSYSTPASLTPDIVTKAGDFLLQRLNLTGYLEYQFIKTVS